MKPCDCPDRAQIPIGTWDKPYEVLCNCCSAVYAIQPPPVELDPWEKPGHVCVCRAGSGQDGDEN